MIFLMYTLFTNQYDVSAIYIYIVLCIINHLEMKVYERCAQVIGKLSFHIRDLSILGFGMGGWGPGTCPCG